MPISGILSGKMIFDYSQTHLTFFLQIPLAWYGWSRWYHCCINGFNCCYNCLLGSRSVFKFKDGTTTDTGIVSAHFVCEIVARLCVHKNTKNIGRYLKALSHCAIFLATCNAVLLDLSDVNLWQMFGMLKIY